ncbi:MAG: UvrD-helicase domain-containing protein [Clostridia bacterium]|nr:UvrD-helicase domain-containing protein [Clostridia bacterium]
MMNLSEKYTKAKQNLFDKVFGERLNPEQCRAVFTLHGPLLVLAGAGSGKTTVLVNRITYLLRYGNAYFSDYVPDTVTEETVAALESALSLPTPEIEEILPGFISEPCPPWSVLAITFTNKAAGEIKARLDEAFHDKNVTDSIWAGTFHSMCLRILRVHCEKLGYREGMTIYDADDAKRLISECMKDLRIDEKRLSPRAVADMISRAKDRLETPESYSVSEDPRGGDVAKIYRLYAERLMKNNAVDFDDIILKTVELLRSFPEVREYYQNKFRYILVDEYQDTNHAQFVLTSLLADKHRNIMVVGDDDQSIYRFRGATVENILSFDRTYPDATVIKLEQNYRSTENILGAANAIIKHNEQRHTKSLWSERGDGEKITVRELADQNEECRYVIDRISKAVKNEGKRYSDFAVLYRVNELSRSLETSFAKAGVPYRILCGTRFYDRAEIKDMIAYLSVINSPDDTLRLMRIINEPKRKIGDAAIRALTEIANAENTSVYEVIKRCDEYTALKRYSESLSEFSRLLESVKERYSRPSELIGALFSESGYREMLVAEGFTGEGKIKNVEELISGAAEYEKRCDDAGTSPTLQGYLEEVALVADVDKYDADADAVVAMTIHSAKGLEFPTVFLIGMEDGIFPSERNMYDSFELSEERRLCYVAITRAKNKLFITHTQTRMMYGRTGKNRLSVFVREELPKQFYVNETPRREPPKRPPTYFDPFAQYASQTKERYPERRSESARDIFPKRPSPTAASFGVEKLAVGTRVEHSIFGAGTITAARDLGGDVLYDISFDTVGPKKLMATYAKLKKL